MAKGIKVTSLGSGGKKSGIKTTSVQHGRCEEEKSFSLLGLKKLNSQEENFLPMIEKEVQ